MTTRCLLAFFLLAIFLCAGASAQTTVFTQQGQLIVSGNLANGNFDFEFKLFDDAAGGNQVGSTVQRLNVAVTNGIYAVSLDFGAAALPGDDRFLAVAVRTVGGGAFTQLTPRQPVTSAPYAVRSLNAGTATTATSFTGALAGDVTGTQGATAIAPNAVTTAKLANGSVTDAKIVDVAGSKITGTIPVGAVPAGSANYIQNQNAGAQIASNFNISGNGTANIFSAATQYNIGAERVLSQGGAFNLFAGGGAGLSNTGNSNSFFGINAGRRNETGNNNAFFGTFAGDLNRSGLGNSFFGALAGGTNETGSQNAFFGASAGRDNQSSNNAFFGVTAGISNTLGNSNAFFGAFAGDGNMTGSRNTIIGTAANVLVDNLTNATALGYRAAVGASNSLVLGSINGVALATADTKVGIGTTAPTAKLTVAGGGLFDSPGAARFDLVNTVANFGYLQNVTDTGLWQMATTTGSTLAVVNSAGDVGIGTLSPARKLHVGGRARIGSIPQEAAFGSVCFNAAGDLLQCGASSLRWKTNVQPFSDGLSILRQLRPISYNWKDGGVFDIGLGAEDVARVAPFFAFRNKEGVVEGVRYERLNMVLINAVNQQQTQIERQQEQLKAQADEIAALKALICVNNPAEVCRKK